MKALLALALTGMALSGCTVMRPAPPAIKLKPPVELIQDCPIPNYTTATNAALAGAIQVLKQGIVNCNVDKAALRRWSEDEVLPDGEANTGGGLRASTAQP